MADRPGEHKAQETREVVAEAAASLKEDPVYQNAADEFSGKEPPADDVSPEESREEAPQDEGSPTEPAAPDALDDDEEVRDDYDPESEAVYPDEEDKEGETPPVAAKPQDQEPEPTTTPETPSRWSEQDQKDYEEFKAFRESQQAQREPETPKESEQAVPQGEPTQQDLQGVIQGLITTDYRVRQAVEGLDARKKTITSNRERLTELKTESEKVAKDLAAHQAKLNAHQELAKDVDMDPDYIRPKVQQAQHSVYELSSQRHQLLLEAERLERQTDRLAMEYENGMLAVNQAGRDAWDSRVREAQDKDSYDRSFKRAREEWKDAIPRVTKDWGLDPSLAEDVGRELKELSVKASDDDIAEGRLEGWMRSQRENVVGRFERIRQATLRQYAADKQADVSQPAPPPERATAAPRRDVPLSSRDADRLAAKNLVQRLRSVAR
jgi:hypothetical protein